MIQKFYNDNVALQSNSSAYNVESSMRTAIQNAHRLSMKKIIENDRTEVTVDTVNPENDKKMPKFMGAFWGFQHGILRFFYRKSQLTRKCSFLH